MQVVVSCGGTVKEAKPHQLILLFPERTMRLLRAHSWPGNLREFAMTIENAVMLSLAEAISAGRPPGVRPAATRADVVQIRPKMVRDLMVYVRTEDSGENERWLVHGASYSTAGRLESGRSILNDSILSNCTFVSEVILRAWPKRCLVIQMIRKVQLRFNQLGLKVRELKARS